MDEKEAEEEIRAELAQLGIGVVSTEEIAGGEPIVLMTMRTADTPPMVPGSVTGYCSNCKEPVNVSPASVETLEACEKAGKPGLVICSVCMMSVIGKGEDDG